MWPFQKNVSKVPVISDKHVQDAIDELGYVRLNQLNKAFEHAFKRAVDPSSLEDGGDDNSGYFGPEFDLMATAGRLKSVYRREPWVYAATSLIARTLATVPYNVVNKQTGEIDETHPLNAILKAGNDIQDRMSMDWSGNLDLVLGGNFFQIVEGEKVFHIPVEMCTMRLATTVDEIRKFGPIIGLDIQGSIRTGSPYQAPKFIEWKYVIHHKLPNPYNPFVGLSLIAAAARPILLDRHKNEFEMAFYLRGATNAGVIETTEDITKGRMERLMRTFEASFTGRRNWFRQLFLPKGAKWVNSSLTMSEMQHLEGLRENRLTLLAVLGVPPMMVGIVEDVNRATAETQEKVFWQNTIIPLAQMKAAGWNKSFLVTRTYRGEIEIKPNFDGIEAVEGGILSRAERSKALENVATINEQRAVAGLPPLKKTDPRGVMFTIELSRSAVQNPFDVPTSAPNPDDLGPEDGDANKISVEVGAGDGKDAHTHTAEIDELGNGTTVFLQGDGEPHDHEIIAGAVQPGGSDGHSHPDVEIPDQNEEKTLTRSKQSAVNHQNEIEASEGSKYLKSYNRHLDLKMAQVTRALNNGVDDVRSYLLAGTDIRLEQYVSDAVKVLEQSMNRGFVYGQNQTRHFGRYSRKAYDFTPNDEMAIEAIKERTTNGERKLLQQRSIERFKGFDRTETEQISKIVEDGLKEGKTHEQVANTIRQTYGENYGDQAFTIARTETLSAVSQGINWQHQTLTKVFSEVNKQWFHVGDAGSNPDARVEHAEFEKVGDKGVVPSEYVWVNPATGGALSYPRDPNAGAADVINCRCSMVSVIPNNAQSNAPSILNP